MMKKVDMNTSAILCLFNSGWRKSEHDTSTIIPQEFIRPKSISQLLLGVVSEYKFEQRDIALFRVCLFVILFSVSQYFFFRGQDMGPVMVISIVVPIVLNAKNEYDAHGVRSQIEKLWNQHKEEILLITQLSQVFKALQYTESLHKKLDEIELFSKQNWELALKKLVDHNNMFQNYSDDLSQKMAKNAQFSGGSLLWVMATKLGSSLSIAATQCAIPTILEVAGYTAQKAGSLVASQAAKATVRNALKKVFSVTNVLVVASICFTIIEFNNGRKTINELEQILKKDKQYFSDKGKFQQQVVGAIQSLIFLIEEVNYLVITSKAMFEDLHNLYLIKSQLEIPQAAEYFIRAKEILYCKQTLSDQFVDEMSVLAKIFRSIGQNNALTNIQKLDFFKEFISTNLSKKWNGKNLKLILKGAINQVYSIIRDDEKMKQQRQKLRTLQLFFDEQYFKYEMQAQIEISKLQIKKKYQKLKKQKDREFSTKNDIKNARVSYGAEEKRQLQILSIQKSFEQFRRRKHKNILDQIEAKYRKQFNRGLNLDKNDQKIIAKIIFTYCKQFYATDSSGSSVYGYSLLQLKKTIQMKKIQQPHENSETNRIFLHYDDEEVQQNERERLLLLAKKQALKIQGDPALEELAFVKSVKELKSQTRYLQLETTFSFVEPGKPIPVLNGLHGFKFKFRGNLYVMEENTRTKDISLIVI